VRKLLFLFVLTLVVSLRVTAAEPVTLTMTDGLQLSGDIVKFDDNGVLLRATGEVYTNLPWGRFSQETLKQLTANPKIKPFVEVFIEPDVSKHPAKAEIQINPVSRLERPANPSIFGGLFGSSVGWFVIFIVYLANLYAAYEVSIIRARSPLQVIGVAAIAPIIAPAVFLAMPIKISTPVEGEAEPGAPAPPGTPAAKEEIKFVDSSWKQAEEEQKKKAAQPQIFARGKFTFNKRFVETKFAGYVGEPKGDALKFTMQLKTGQGEFTVERIAQVGTTDAIFETAERGQLTVPFADIQEIKLTPKAA
jgi:hypothetical protein